MVKKKGVCEKLEDRSLKTAERDARARRRAMDQGIQALLARLGDQAADANLERQAATAAAVAREATRRQEEEVRGAVRTVTTCDGTISGEVCEWIRAVDVIHARDAAIVIPVATRTSKGRLIETIEGYIATQAGLVVPIARAAVP